MEAEAPWAVPAGAASLHGLCQQLQGGPGTAQIIQLLILLNAGEKNQTQKQTSFANKLQ